MKAFLILCCLIFSPWFSVHAQTGVLKKQKELLKGISLVNNPDTIVLKHGDTFIQKRGVLNDTYACNVPGGQYELLWQSDSGQFYLCLNDQFLCEQAKIGGVFISSNGSKNYVWVYPGAYFKSESSTVEWLKSPKAVAGFKKIGAVKPFIYTYYLISLSVSNEGN